MASKVKNWQFGNLRHSNWQWKLDITDVTWANVGS